MDVPSVMRQRLAELGIEQRDLATVAHVTESENKGEYARISEGQLFSL